MAAPLRRGRVDFIHAVGFSYSKLTSFHVEWKLMYSGYSHKKSIPSFVDFLQLTVCGGAGGQGFPKFGGFGGNGGNVTITAKKKIKTLKQVMQKYPRQMCKAGIGENSSKFRLLGDKGKNLDILVPKGVIVHKADGQKVDLNNAGDTCTVALGGSGGNSTNNFLGMKGDQYLINLELKLLADVGLVGFPNAGKSTLLKALSKAKPEIAAYPFTTITPQIGMMEFKDGRKISVADLPGLIEGAHMNHGMGIKFLRHAERTKLLVFVLDINPFQLSHKYPERSAFETLLLLNKELEEYGHGMIEKPALLALNKIDTDTTGTKVNHLLDCINNLPDSLDLVDSEFHPTRLVQFDSIFTISAMKKKNVVKVKENVRSLMDKYAEIQRLETLNGLNEESLKQEWTDLHKEHLKKLLV